MISAGVRLRRFKPKRVAPVIVTEVIKSSAEVILNFHDFFAWEARLSAYKMRDVFELDVGCWMDGGRCYLLFIRFKSNFIC